MAEILTISIAETEIGCNDLFAHTPAERAAGLKAHMEVLKQQHEAMLKVKSVCLAVTPAMAKIITAQGGHVYWNGRVPYIRTTMDKLVTICE